MRVIILVTHLLGTGHLSRMITLAKAFNRAGHQLKIISGGKPAPHLDADGFDLEQLPSVSSDGVNFTRLLDENGQDVCDKRMLKRKSNIKEILESFKPNVFITELYPFGRRVLGDEFLSALEAAKALNERPLILASVRDILAAPSSPAKAEKSEQVIYNHYDGVLVHGDNNVVALGDSWPHTSRLNSYLTYTGYVADKVDHVPLIESDDGHNEVIVTAGGGPVGEKLTKAAILAAQSPDNMLVWRVLIGGGKDLPVVDHPNLIIERVRNDYKQLISRAACSVSQLGYNTALDLVSAKVPAVIVPFEEGGETEQITRAQLFCPKFGWQIIREQNINAKLLNNAVSVAISGKDNHQTMNINGADNTVVLVDDMVRMQRHV